MNEKRILPANLFLLELVIVICFFTFAGVVATQVFMKADELTRNTAAQNGAVMTVQTAAEAQREKPFDELSTKGQFVYFDSKWQSSPQAKADYMLASETRLEKRRAGMMAITEFKVTEVPSKGAVLYQIENRRYYPKEGGGANE